MIDADRQLAVAELESDQEELKVRVGGVSERVVGEKLRVGDGVSVGVPVTDMDRDP